MSAVWVGRDGWRKRLMRLRGGRAGWVPVTAGALAQRRTRSPHTARYAPSATRSSSSLVVVPAATSRAPSSESVCPPGPRSRTSPLPRPTGTPASSARSRAGPLVDIPYEGLCPGGAALGELMEEYRWQRPRRQAAAMCPVCGYVRVRRNRAACQRWTFSAVTLSRAPRRCS